MDPLVTPAVLALIKEGSGWAVSVLLGCWSIYLYKQVEKSRTICDKSTEAANQAVKDQYEKRLAEFRELIEVMANSTATVKAMHGSLTATTEAINQLAQGFAKLLAEFQSQQSRWDDRGSGMARQLEDIRQRLENLQREVRAA